MVNKIKISPQNWDLIIKIILLIIILLVAWQVYKKIKGEASKAVDAINPFKDSEEEKKEKENQKKNEEAHVRKAKENAKKSKETPSFTNDTMLRLADKLYNSKKKWYQTNDVNAFNYVIKSMDNDLDFTRLEIFFGVRDGMALKKWIADTYNADFFNEWMKKNKPKLKFRV